jgi:hypothetical protein
MASHDDIHREVLPIPDLKPVSLTTYDAKDPDTKFPPIRPLRPPTGAEFSMFNTRTAVHRLGAVSRACPPIRRSLPQ